MEFVSILNDVLGPVMRGPSSSHTAGSYRLARLAKDLLGDRPAAVNVVFDPDGSYGRVYRQQGVDLAFACGFLDRPISDPDFADALKACERAGISLDFSLEPLKRADHPNSVVIELEGRGGDRLVIEGKSTGGGAVEITRVDGIEVSIDGKSFLILMHGDRKAIRQAETVIKQHPSTQTDTELREIERNGILSARSNSDMTELADRIKASAGVKGIWRCAPVYYVRKGDPLFAGEAEMIQTALRLDDSLAMAAWEYESGVLGMDREAIYDLVLERYGVMQASLESGLHDGAADMILLGPSASRMAEKLKRGDLPVGGLHARAAANALAVMHTANSRGVVCAAPTGGSAGTLPGVLAALAERDGLSEENIVKGLLAAGAVGLLVARRATFAAEVAGCQVEIGAAGAMAAAAVVEIFGGSAKQACDAAAISFQNTMGSVCDLVQGTCEIPCHTRNAVAASSAFVCADLIMGGYRNPIPLEETIDAVYAVGRQLPPELKVTSLGGLALCPSAKNLKRRR